MNILIPKEQCWIIPQGRHPATCIESKVCDQKYKKKIESCLRLMFEIHIDDSRNVQYVAKRLFPPVLNEGGPLRETLTNWLGRDWMISHRVFNPDMLIGLDAEVDIVHIENPGYDDPFIHIGNVHPLQA